MRMILVEWVDSSFAQGWMSKEHARHHSFSKIASAGILLHEDSEKITIMQSVSDKDDAGDGITIPKCSIKRMRQLKVSLPSLV